MNIINQSFIDQKTGTIHTILNVINGVALTDNIEKIPVVKLMDINLYKPYQENLVTESNTNPVNTNPVNTNQSDIVDPSSFFNSPATYNLFAEKIKNIDTSKLPEDQASVVSIPVRDLGVDNSISAVYTASPEDEMEEVARKYGASLGNQQSVQKQNEAFSKYLTEEEEGPVVRVDVDTHQVSTPVKNVSTTPIPVENPVHAVFRQAKRSLPFKAMVVQEGNLPRLDFIEMMEDSYEISIIDFLAEDYVNKLLSNPGELKNQIKEQIISLLSGKDVTPKPKKLVKPISKDKLVKEKKPTPPPSQLIKEEETPVPPKTKTPRKNKVQS